MANLDLPPDARSGFASVLRYDERTTRDAGSVESRMQADRPAREMLRLVLAAALDVGKIEIAVVCDADGALIAIAPDEPATLESARPFARAALHALDAPEPPAGLFIRRLTETPETYAVLRWRAGCEPRLDLAQTLATTCASLLLRDERAFQAHDALTDGLTGLASRMQTMHQLERAIHVATRAGARCGFLFVDLDGFKAVNDTFGHAAGDRTLGEVGRRIRGTVRRGDVAGRIGGDEFGIVVAMHDGENELIEAAERLSLALRLQTGESAEVRDVTASIGIAVFPEDGTTPQELLERADAAMYAAKRAGGDAVRFFRDGVIGDPRARRALGTALSSADRQRDLLVCYQPVADVFTREIVAVEALVRWRHPTQGWMTPSAFLSELAVHGGALDIDRWVVETALAELNRPESLPLAVHVNIASPDERIAALIEVRSPADARRLAVEVSEQSVLRSADAVAAFFARVKRAGAAVGIDRFGAGRVSADALCSFALDYVKIDRRLTREAARSDRGMRLFRAAIDLVRRFDALPIVEGVERFDDAGLLATAGVASYQGYAVGQPMTAPDLHDWLAAGHALAVPLW